MIVGDPVFLTLGEVIEIHRDQIERYGGDTGIRDLGILQSAKAMPAAGFGGRYLHADLIEMAAAYLFHLTQNHPFIDGNKRTGAVASLVFLSLNGIELEADEEEFERAVLGVAEGKISNAAVAEFFRNNSRS
jgi:death-on-curing protein